MDQRTIKEMKKDMEGIMQENQDYVEKIKDEREMIQRLNHIIEEYDKAVYQQVKISVWIKKCANFPLRPHDHPCEVSSWPHSTEN